jgi:hypothetical protein
MRFLIVAAVLAVVAGVLAVAAAVGLALLFFNLLLVLGGGNAVTP